MKSIFQVRHGENLKSLLLWTVGIEPTTPKTHGLSTTPFVKVIMVDVGIEPTKLSLITGGLELAN